MKRKFTWLAILLAFALVAAACGDDDDAASTDNSDFRIAIVAPSASNDLAFTQSIVDAVAAVGVTPNITDGTFIVDDAAAAIMLSLRQPNSLKGAADPTVGWKMEPRVTRTWRRTSSFVS